MKPHHKWTSTDIAEHLAEKYERDHGERRLNVGFWVVVSASVSLVTMFMAVAFGG